LLYTETVRPFAWGNREIPREASVTISGATTETRTGHPPITILVLFRYTNLALTLTLTQHCSNCVRILEQAWNVEPYNHEGLYKPQAPGHRRE